MAGGFLSLSKYEIQVFVQPTRCVQCDAVKRKLTKLGAPYVERALLELDGSQSEDAAKYVALAKERGASSAPIVVLLRDGELVDLFAGNNPVKVKDFAECLASSLA